jgi:HAE1 family hydrophobic/amphiphilic exporter-1
VLALLASGDTMNIMSLIGGVRLMGVVANNVILLLDVTKWKRDEGAAIFEAGHARPELRRDRRDTAEGGARS